LKYQNLFLFQGAKEGNFKGLL